MQQHYNVQILTKVSVIVKIYDRIKEAWNET